MLKEFEAEFLQLAEDSGAVQMIFDTLRNAMKHAQITVRAPDDSKNGWGYVWSEDWPVRASAARTMAEILRLMPKSNGVTVNHGAVQTVNITAIDRLAELDSIGVPREEIAKACQDLLAVAESGQGGAPQGQGMAKAQQIAKPAEPTADDGF